MNRYVKITLGVAMLLILLGAGFALALAMPNISWQVIAAGF